MYAPVEDLEGDEGRFLKMQEHHNFTYFIVARNDFSRNSLCNGVAIGKDLNLPFSLRKGIGTAHS